ncbi:23S rRNA (uracil(1939)-C(5))-methyltransferase RlmD [Shewanella yunxiaonensis]|uniref:23S rRNA (uracil(1939)-C(5))-methyltransferase RlmD n=1 Tax=Shewanella yunxiaonensis TaxID=2829809 RepID=A0ABX7YQP3_9GAMM|nr:23S rRNA (uracil(1939)-C(5))-methyltransferase RlmD [Shewanella yunxiaonensis]QUN04838.1 23S rRNA (uracil(1939)-C(5))-methyltransferase RlmD [Shewanella yunxiaonensis]
MAQFFKAKPKTSALMPKKIQVTASTLDHLGAGVAQLDGKVLFVPGLLAGEVAEVKMTEDKKQYARAQLIKVQQASEQRCQPLCHYYGSCGGCDLQHLQIEAQRRYKQQVLTELFEKFSGIDVLPEIEVLSGEPVAYRRKARLATWFDKTSKRFFMGFRARESSKVVAVNECPVLAPALSALIKPLASSLAQLQGITSLGHVELIAADSGILVVLRVTKPLSDKDRQRLLALAQKLDCQLVLQGEDGAYDYLHGAQPFYRFTLASQPLTLHFNPGNFIQVNGGVNQLMIAKALEWLAPKTGEHILDLFCGMGNFSLPIAATGAKVTGVEGVPSLVEQAQTNAIAAGLSNAEFYCADLNGDLRGQPWLTQVDKLLLDPSRAGAWELLACLPKLQPASLVYVSCNPANLARDSVRLVEQGYQLDKLVLLDMFPQTHHIEAMALFSHK